MADIDTQFSQVVREVTELRAILRTAPQGEATERKRERLVELTTQAMKINRVIYWRDREHTEGKR